jgi:hypothetical protein
LGIRPAWLSQLASGFLLYRGNSSSLSFRPDSQILCQPIQYKSFSQNRIPALNAKKRIKIFECLLC